jgi:hypothetical protein
MIITLFMQCSSTPWLLVLILMHPPTILIIDCAHGITGRALKRISALKFQPSEDVPLSTL